MGFKGGSVFLFSVGLGAELLPSSSAQDLVPDGEDLVGVDAGMVAAGEGCADDCEGRAG